MYTGKVSKISARGYGFIDRKTLVDKDGQPVVLDTNKDIFLAQADCWPKKLRVGMFVVFEPIVDSRRSKAFRAQHAYETQESRASVWGPPSIELHPDLDIENPSVPMRFCYKPELHKRVTEGLKVGKGYAALLVARRTKGDPGGHHEIREVKDPLQTFSILTFTKPGAWTVDIILFEREESSLGQDTTNSLKLNLSHTFLNRNDSGKLYATHLPSLGDVSFPGDPKRQEGVELHVHRGLPWLGVAIAAHTVQLVIPEEVFAPPPPEAVRTYTNYFFRNKLDDQCDFRRRLLIMIPGFVPWAVCELAKRLVVMLVAFVFILRCAKGSGRLFLYGFEPAIDFKLSDDPGLYRDENRNLVLVELWSRKGGKFYTPAAIITYGAALFLSVTILFIGYRIALDVIRWAGQHKGAVVIFGAVVFVVGTFFLVLLLSKLFKAGLDWLSDRTSEQRTLHYGEVRAALAERQAEALVCGDDVQHVIALRAIPLELQNVGMWARTFKRAVCRPFS